MSVNKSPTGTINIDGAPIATSTLSAGEEDTLTGSSAIYTADGWHILTNVWNPEGLVYGQDYTISATYDPNDIPASPQFTWNFPTRTQTNYFDVHAYPELIFGASPWEGGTDPTDPRQVFPIQVSNLSSFTANYDFSMTGDPGGHNVAFELWLTNTPNGDSTTMTNEVMIWVHQGAFSPGGSPIGSYADEYFTGTVYNAFNWNAGTGSQPWTYTATASSADALNGEIDVGSVIQNLVNLGIVSSSSYIADIELGAEVATGPGSLSVNSLAYSIQTKSGGNYVVGGIPGGTGTNTLTGGVGIQTAVFSGPMSSYTITHSGNAVTVSGTNVDDTLIGIEKAAFSDQTMTLGQGPQSEDFNRDNNSDILWQNTDGQAAIWTMNGFTQVGGQPIGGDPGSNWKVVGAADFNGDGMADILWQDTDNGQVVVWTMNGFTQTSSTFIGGAPGAQWKVVATGDFAGNGQEDLVFQNAGGQAVLWTMNATSQTASTFVGGDPGSQWHIVGTGDFNGDGKSDIVWQDSDNGQVVVWTMNGTSQTGSFFVGDAPGSDWKVAGVGDFAGNGQADLLFQNTTTGQPVLWTMSGTTQSASTFIGGNPGPTWHIEGVGDYNGDGKADILWQNDNGQAAVWTMNGATQLGGSPVGGNPGTSWHIPAGVG